MDEPTAQGKGQHPARGHRGSEVGARRQSIHRGPGSAEHPGRVGAPQQAQLLPAWRLRASEKRHPPGQAVAHLQRDTVPPNPPCRGVCRRGLPGPPKRFSSSLAAPREPPPRGRPRARWARSLAARGTSRAAAWFRALLGQAVAAPLCPARARGIWPSCPAPALPPLFPGGDGFWSSPTLTGTTPR